MTEEVFVVFYIHARCLFQFDLDGYANYYQLRVKVLITQHFSSAQTNFTCWGVLKSLNKTLLHLLSLGVIRPCSQEQVTSGEVQVGNGCGFRVVRP